MNFYLEYKLKLFIYLGVNLLRHESQKSKIDDIIVNPNYENRNPRNLEWSGHQNKRFGWNLQYPPKDFYHQCVFVKNSNNLEAYLEHHSNGILFNISTSDLPLRQYLFRYVYNIIIKISMCIINSYIKLILVDKT